MGKIKFKNNYEDVDDAARDKIAADIGQGNIEGITQTADGRRVSWKISVNVFDLNKELRAMADDIAAAVAEFIKDDLYNELTTSDLQGICTVRAWDIIKKHDPAADFKNSFFKINEVQDKILSGIYEAVESEGKKS